MLTNYNYRDELTLVFNGRLPIKYKSRAQF